MIGIAINYLLKQSLALYQLVGDKIYPLAIEEDVTLPGVLYRVVSTTPEYTKDGLAEETHAIEVVSYALTYINALNVSQEVRNALELKKGTFSSIHIVSSRINSIEESYDFDQNVYFSKINLTIKTI